MPNDAVCHTNIHTTTYEPFLVEGRPFGEVHWLRTTGSGSGLLLAGLWKHPPATFDYTFPADETLHVLEGRVRIQVQGGDAVELRPGDLASFPRGALSTWTILEPLKKFFVTCG
ncbi:MAG: cupin domain-containing protein [Planctomycetaceae bacterium]